MTQHFGVVGHPVSHSLSPTMFGAAFWEYNLDADYELFDVEPAQLSEFLKRVPSEPIAGLSVTIPHKETIVPLLNAVDEKAKIIGAVNTVVNKDGKLKGYNTDWQGALKALEEVTDLSGKTVVVLGAGGAAAAIMYACRQAGATVIVLNRTEEKAKELADRFGCGYGLLDEILQHPADVLVHTTSVGMTPHTDVSLVPRAYFKRGMIVMDIVYNPLETKLVKEARAVGCKIIPGHKMLLYQAEKQFELWFKKKPPVEKMEKAVVAALQLRIKN